MRLNVLSKNNITFRKLIIIISVLFLIAALKVEAKVVYKQKKQSHSFFFLKVKNNLDRDRKDALLTIPISHIKRKYPRFTPKVFTAFVDKVVIPSQLEDVNGDKIPDNILLLLNLAPQEAKSVEIQYGKSSVMQNRFNKRTQAILASKVDYKLKDGYYTGGAFQNILEIELPKDHFPHDALIKFEGPGWESDKVGYRFYLDSRNRNDIFGKKVDDVVLHHVGNYDLISDGKESYTKMSDWGMDIFKVGESLGIGSIGMWANEKVQTVSKADKIICKITANGIIKSNILTSYKGWIVDDQKYDMNSLISISAGSRLTKEEISISASPKNICTGLAKHAGCTLLRDENNFEWGYIASYGKQSLAGDSLGIVLFYKKSDLVSLTEDETSFITILKPTNRKITYYFAAAPQMELDGIKSKDEFLKYITEVIAELSSPVVFDI